MWPFTRRCKSRSIAAYNVRNTNYERIVRCSRPRTHIGNHMYELSGGMAYESLVYQWTDEGAIK